MRSLLDAGVQLGATRFFIGYAGWTPGQLEDEIRADRGSLQRRCRHHHEHRTEDETLWKSLITEMGEGFDHIANAPVDPSMN